MKNDEMVISNVEISQRMGEPEGMNGREVKEPDYYEAEITIYGQFDSYNDAHNTISAIVNMLTNPTVPEIVEDLEDALADEPMTAQVQQAVDGAPSVQTNPPPQSDNPVPVPGPNVDPPREPGKPSPGRKRRTKAEMAEDQVLDEADPRDEASENPHPPTAEAPARLGRSKPSNGTPGRPTRPMAPDAPEEEPEISDHDMYGAAGHGAAILGPDEVTKLLNAFDVKRAGDIAQEYRQQFLDEIKNCIAAMSS